MEVARLVALGDSGGVICSRGSGMYEPTLGFGQPLTESVEIRPIRVEVKVPVRRVEILFLRG